MCDPRPQRRRLEVGAVPRLLIARPRRVIRTAPAVVEVARLDERPIGLLPARRRNIEALARLQVTPRGAAPPTRRSDPGPARPRRSVRTRRALGRCPGRSAGPLEPRRSRPTFFCRRSRSTSITFPGEPRAMTRAAGRVQGPRYRAARSRSRRCVSRISDKSTRNSAKARAFSARNASSLNQLLDRGPSNTTFLGHTFRVLASNFKPGAQMAALDVFFGESHRSSWSIQVKALLRCRI